MFPTRKKAVRLSMVASLIVMAGLILAVPRAFSAPFQPAIAQAPPATLQLSFTVNTNPPVIAPGIVIPYEMAIHNNGSSTQDAMLVLPGWVRLGAPSNRHWILDKGSQLVWHVKNLKPGEIRNVFIPVVVSTAMDPSACAAGDWHFGARLYAGNLHLADHQEVCYSLPA